MTTNSEKLSQLEVLLLVLVNAGIATPYDLLTQLGIGVGTSSPALQRMEERSLLTCTPGPRNRMRFSITQEGKEYLKGALKEGLGRYWRHGNRDTFDSLRRVILLAWLGSNIQSAKSCVDEAERRLDELFERRVAQAGEHLRAVRSLEKEMLKGVLHPDDPRMISKVSGWIDAEFDKCQFKSQIQSLQTVRELIANLPSSPNIWAVDALTTNSSLGRERSAREPR